MNKPPRNSLRVALTRLTITEKFRDEERDVLLFIDNIYRYTISRNRTISLLDCISSTLYQLKLI